GARRNGAALGSATPSPRGGFFFFQAEDGIRDWSVTGVQTCALPISYTPCRAAGLQLARRARLSPATDAEDWPTDCADAPHRRRQIGRASCRERGQISVGGGSVRKERARRRFRRERG